MEGAVKMCRDHRSDRRSRSLTKSLRIVYPFTRGMSDRGVYTFFRTVSKKYLTLCPKAGDRMSVPIFQEEL